MSGQFVFFDSREVVAATDKATRRALSKFGAFVRQRARSSIRKRKSVSAAGSPPNGHTGRLKKSILFGYDTKTKSVVVGPLRYGSRAAELLEHGGTADGRVYQPRPFMQPAFDAELPKASELLRDKIK